MSPLNERSLSKRDICTKFITPAIDRAGWDLQNQVREEVNFTKGRIIVRGKTHTPNEKATIFANWALNTVGTCYYIHGRAFRKLGRTDEARRAFQRAVEFSHARTWDPAGWFWSPAEAAGKELVIRR